MPNWFRQPTEQANLQDLDLANEVLKQVQHDLSFTFHPGTPSA